MQLDNSISAVVTGGASGLARATATALAEKGIRVAIFDLNVDDGSQVAHDIGATFHHVDVTDEASVVNGFEEARAANGQERILVHCAQTSKRGKTISRNRETGELTRLSTEDYAYSADGILVASYRMASLAALGMASLVRWPTTNAAASRSPVRSRPKMPKSVRFPTVPAKPASPDSRSPLRAT